MILLTIWRTAYVRDSSLGARAQDYDARWRYSVGQKAQSDLASEVKYYGTDVTDFCAVNDLLDLETIPLSSALTILGNVKQVLRTCGTTAFRTQGDLKGITTKSAEALRTLPAWPTRSTGRLSSPFLFGLAWSRGPSRGCSLSTVSSTSIRPSQSSGALPERWRRRCAPSRKRSLSPRDGANDQPIAHRYRDGRQQGAVHSAAQAAR